MVTKNKRGKWMERKSQGNMGFSKFTFSRKFYALTCQGKEDNLHAVFEIIRCAHGKGIIK